MKKLSSSFWQLAHDIRLQIIHLIQLFITHAGTIEKSSDKMKAGYIQPKIF